MGVTYYPHLMGLEIEVERLSDLPRVSQVVKVNLMLNHGQDPKMDTRSLGPSLWKVDTVHVTV